MKHLRNAWLPIAFLVFGVFFFTGEQFLSGKVMAAGGSIYKDLDLFSQILERVQNDYVEEVDPHKLIMAGIDGMLGALDPHTQFLDEDQYGNLMVSTQGSFGGLGIVIAVRDGILTVISPMEGTPAYQMGIQGGDQILLIDGESTEGIKNEDAVKRLRGPKGTKVTISIRREGVEDLIDYTITRDVIELHSVPYAFMVPGQEGIGYVRVSQFMKTTSQDLETAIDKLEKNGHLNGLVLDLRNNPGGLLEQAVSVSDLFLDKGDLVTFTKGRKRSSSNEFYDENDSRHTAYPMIVLVNGGSASASEIVAGAIQDWDRGLIVGKTTFGKGSVQSVLPLSKDTGLKLTTAKYYTPSGRSIHKDDKVITVLKEAHPDSAVSKHPEFKTKAGRTVYGGGGIEPDITIDSPQLSKFAGELERKTLFFEYAGQYLGKHKSSDGKSLAGSRNSQPVNNPTAADKALRELVVTDDMLSEFKTLVKSKEIEFTDQDFDGERPYIEMGIRREVMRRQFGDEYAYKAAIGVDEQLKGAFELFGKARTLREMFALAETERAKNPLKHDDGTKVPTPDMIEDE